MIDEKYSKDIVIHGKNQESIHSFLDTININELIKLANNLPWRVDVQFKNDSFAVYLAGRNDDIENNEDLAKLLEFTKKVAKSIIKKQKL